MAQFQYRATDFQGKIVEGSMEAGEERSVVQRLREKGLIPIRIGAGRRGAARASKAITLPTHRRPAKARQDLRAPHLHPRARDPPRRRDAARPQSDDPDGARPDPELKRVTGEVLEAVRGGIGARRGARPASEGLPPALRQHGEGGRGRRRARSGVAAPGRVPRPAPRSSATR